MFRYLKKAIQICFLNDISIRGQKSRIGLIFHLNKNRGAPANNIGIYYDNYYKSGDSLGWKYIHNIVENEFIQSP